MTEPQPEIRFVKNDWDSISGIHRFSHEAMATTFEVITLYEDARYAEQAAWAAFDKLDRLEAELSRFIENTDISRINNLPAGKPLQIGLDTFECLQLAAQIYAETNGAFDVTIGSLLGCWLNEDKTIRTPSQAELDIARQHTGMHLIKLDEASHTVQLATSPVQIDLGGIGKGYAVDRMAELLGEWSIDTALIHGGYSSVLALDGPPGTKGWPVSLSNPRNRKQTLACLCLQNRAVGGSGLLKGQHIINPRTAQPIQADQAEAPDSIRPAFRGGKSAAWAFAPTAATADALSTAFMVMSPKEIKQYCRRHPKVLAMLILQGRGKEAQKEKILHFGPWKKDDLIK